MVYTKDLNCRSGFSLIEVLIGTALLFIGITSAMKVYLDNMRLSREMDMINRAYAIAIQEMEGIKRVNYTVWYSYFRNRGKPWCSNCKWNYSYRYVFKGFDSNGNPLRGMAAITEISDTRLLNWWDKYKKVYFDPMGIEEGEVLVYFNAVPVNTSLGIKDKDWVMTVRVAVIWKDHGKVYGGDKDLNGHIFDYCYWHLGQYICGHEETEFWMDRKVFKSPVVLEGVVGKLF